MKVSNNSAYSFRKFPYPYRAMFAISSDLDHARSLDSYLEFQKYLNTNQETRFGMGLDLELGNSFWFYNARGDDQLSYFKGVSSEESEFAGPCRDLWRSGHLDTLHSYGDFNDGGFQRALAEQAVAELIKHDVTIPVWVNHGNDNNHQNIGDFAPYQGANPASASYHLDLLQDVGTRFFWMGRTTHVAGQDASFSIGNQLQQKLQKLVLKTKYRKIQRPLPDAPNRVLVRSLVEDGRQLLEFQRFISRFGEVKNTDFYDLALQLTDKNLAALINSSGFMLLYTHMNENLPEKGPLPQAVLDGFLRLKALHDKQDLLVTTSSRLLTYADNVNHLTLTLDPHDDIQVISLTRDDHAPLTLERLMGVTLYCPDPTKVRIMVEGNAIELQVNPPDSTGRSSVSIPWKPLVYPL